MSAENHQFHLAESAQDRDVFQRKHGIIGRSMEMREVVDVLMHVAPTDITVLITGESGTGKEVVARAIHHASTRARKTLVSVNCGAIPEGILESELFGHEKGSFTGAVDSRKGYFEIANGGTIFLDEIGEMPIATQVKLLRVLENGEFMRVGSSVPTYVDVRIIAATNKDLEHEVTARRFRQDLYYRLRSVNIKIPPLRVRRADIWMLAESFIEELAKDDATMRVMFTEDAKNLIIQYPWPGNVRELRNVIESISVLERGNVVDAHTLKKYLHIEHFHPPVESSLPVHLNKSPEQAERELVFAALLRIQAELSEIKSAMTRLTPHQLSLPAPQPIAPPMDEAEAMVSLNDFSLPEMEKRMIEHALTRFEGNRRLAARALKISERTLYRKIKEYNLA